ncbi:hypothetical protein Nepgr_018589 [Nepenthes gracilis]|uniref:Uncharacterized protein n=1 Tax=Nepenthes gracilis TaxID=150966 RepID=A0AAD3SSI1_NEPGR|nr:hypothetical protein Nepgr_018589 [Nepenthes gracilis]
MHTGTLTAMPKDIQRIFIKDLCSGMLVQDPSKDGDIDAIFNRAKQLGAVERVIDSSLHSSSSSRSFIGTERFLSYFLESIRNS